MLKQVQFDNRAAEASILPATLPGVQTGCSGILSYTGAASVQVSFKADQPGGFGAYFFDVRQGFVDNQSPVRTQGVVREAASDPAFGYDPGPRTYSRSVTASKLLTHSHASFDCICPPMPPAGSASLCPEATRHAAACTPGAGALSEVLGVYAAVTNGYERLWELDRHDHAAFALIRG